MAFKMKGFPIQGTKSAFKQAKTYEPELTEVKSTKEVGLEGELDEEYLRLKKLAEEIGVENLTAKDREAYHQKANELYDVGWDRRKTARAHGTYEEYLLTAGDDPYSKEEWLELNKENIRGT